MSNELSKTYGFDNESVAPQTTALADAQGNKSVQEIQAALVIAKKYPRNESESFSRIMKACERPILAEQAMYAYPKGGTLVTGPSIRLAEVLSQHWGNMSVGIREISQSNGVSEVEAFAWDLETNSQSTKIFHVPHVRNTKKGSYKITDNREIYEMVANQGARRLRACILAVIPGDIVDAAVEQCVKTQSSGKEPLADRVKKLIRAFDEVGVSVELIEKRLGHSMEAIVEQELVTLRSVYKSIKDGMADRKDFFDFGESKTEESAKDKIESLISKKADKASEKQKDEKA